MGKRTRKLPDGSVEYYLDDDHVEKNVFRPSGEFEDHIWCTQGNCNAVVCYKDRQTLIPVRFSCRHLGSPRRCAVPGARKKECFLYPLTL